MNFNSWAFLVFLVITFCGYHFLPYPANFRRLGQIVFLTLASYVFYGWTNPWLVLLLVASTGVNAVAAHHLVDRSNPHRRRWLLGAIFFNLATLMFFKYAALIVTTFLPESLWSHWGRALAEIPLPIGISFFTFQGISLAVDVYRGEEETGLETPQNRNEGVLFYLKVAFFKAFFPQLVAGPIVKAHEFIPQVPRAAGKWLSDIDWDSATKKLILGFFFKMVLADNLKDATALLAYPTFLKMPSINMIVLLYGFSFQILADFAGYSFIAMGLAELFGYRLPLNFDFPYLSRSITEFWRRWHISLSSWLREYLYIPLGGNRKGSWRTYGNLMAVMLIGGLWHGAAWSYMIWGGAHGLFLAIERMFGARKRENRAARAGKEAPRGFAVGCVHLIQVLITFNLVSLLWLLFKLPRFDEAVIFIQHLYHWKGGVQLPLIFPIAIFSAPLVAYHLWGEFRMRITGWVRWLHPTVPQFAFNSAYAVLLFLVITNSGTSGTFIYFQF